MPPERGPLPRIAVALGSTALAFGLALLLDPLLEPNPFPELFLAAVALSAWWGGLRSGLLATLTSLIASVFLFQPPVATSTILAELFVFLMAALLINALQGRLRSAGQRAEASMIEAQHQQLRLAFLAEASSVLGSSLDYEATFQSVARLAVPFVADYCSLDILEESGGVRRAGLAHVVPRQERVLRELNRRYPVDQSGPQPLMQVLQTGRSYLRPEVTDERLAAVARDAEHLALLRTLGADSAMCVPLLARGRILGAITLVAAGSNRRFAEPDLALAEDLARRCAAAIDNARLFREAEEEIAERTRAEERLRQSEERLSLALDAARLGTWDWNVESGEVTVSWSNSFTPVLGPAGTFRGSFEQFIDLVDPMSRPAFAAAISRALETGADVELEFQTAWLDGTRRWIAGKGRIQCDEHGKPVRMIGVPMDITERKRAEERLAIQYATTRVLAESETLQQAVPGILQTVCECLGWDYGGLWSVDADANLLRCVETWHTPGRRVAEFEAVSRQITFPPGVGLPGRVWESGEPAWIPDVVQDANFPRAQVAAREELHAAFGFPIWSGSEILGVLEFFSHEIRPPDEPLLQMIATVGTQIGQFMKRRSAEEERSQLFVREQAARAQAETAEWRSRFLAEAGTVLSASLDYRATLESVARLTVPYLADWCTVDVIGEDGDVQRMAAAHPDPAKAELLRGLIDRYPPTSDHPFLAPHGQPRLLTEVTDELLASMAEDAEHLRLLRELRIGSYMSVALVARGRTLGGIGVASAEPRRYAGADLALLEELARRAALAIDNARLYQEAQEEARRKDEFLAMLGHELRNPLGAIRSALAVLNRVSSQAEGAVRQRAIIERQALHLGRLVDDLLEVSRVTSGKIALQRSPLDLNSVVANAVQSLRAAVTQRPGQVSLSLAAAPVMVAGDPVRLEQVFCNLLDNAIKYTPPAGDIRITVVPEGGEAVVRVRDSGIGIAPQMLPRIFELFTQAERSLDRAQGGLGLGLPLVRRLVELHGGNVSAESAGLEQGSEFVVRLPLLAELRVEAPRTPPPAALDIPRSAARRILVVEDNADGRDALRTLLELWGHQVDVAEDGPQGVEVACTNRPDVALIDIGLPGIDGYQVAERLRAVPGRRICLVALTGYGQPDDRRRALDAGFEAHLVKPVDPMELARLLATLPAVDAA